MDQRQYTLPGVWALNANTQIPIPPVVGLSYRNTSLSTDTVNNGQSYKRIGDSADWNQFMMQQSGLVQMTEQYGIMPYSPFTQFGERALTLWTDGKLYRVIEGQVPPKGTPPTNKTYWEEYTPDTTGKLPITTVSSGFSMYVDYRRTTSGDGLTEATAFKNITDCLEALRKYYSAVNGLFVSSAAMTARAATFNIVINGDPNTSSETLGFLQVNNMFLALVVNVTGFKLNTKGFFFTGGSCILSGTGTLEIPDGIFHMEQGQAFINAPLTVRATTVDRAAGYAMYFANSRIDINADVTVTSTNGTGSLAIDASVLGVNARFSGIQQGVGTSSNVSFMGSIVIIGRSFLSDTNNAPLPATNIGLTNLFIASGAVANFADIHVYSGSAVNVEGTIRIGSAYVTMPQGTSVQWGYVTLYNGGTVASYGNVPASKGHIISNGAIYAVGIAQNAWPGTAGFSLGNGGAYYS